MDGLKDVKLDTVAQGAAPELWEDACHEVLENIADVNRDPKAKREILLKVTFEPSEDRETLVTTVDVVTKLAPRKGHAAAAYLARRKGELVAVTYDVRQRDMFAGEDAEDTSVTPLHSKQREA